jgi:hypothetical protein
MCWAHHFWPALLSFHLFVSFILPPTWRKFFLHFPSPRLSDVILNVLTASPVYMFSIFLFHRNTPDSSVFSSLLHFILSSAGAKMTYPISNSS